MTFSKVLKMIPPVDVEPEESFISEVETRCSKCAYLDLSNPVVCQAFPNGIPTVIMLGLIDHTLPYIVDGEEADGGLRYLTREEMFAEYPESVPSVVESVPAEPPMEVAKEEIVVPPKRPARIVRDIIRDERGLIKQVIETVEE